MRYGITLQRLCKEQTEMVHLWRNDEKISHFMFYKGEITPSMQTEWFVEIDNEQNFFFVVIYREAPIGLINISSIDWENKTAYTGLFIYDEKFWATDVPVMASLAMLDVFFLLFNVRIVYAKVKGDNTIAHNYNSALGFRRIKKIEFALGYEYMLQKEIYLLTTKELRNAAMRLKGNSTMIEFDSDNKTDAWTKEKLNLAKKEIMGDLNVTII